MTHDDTDARDIVARCEDALKRRDMLLEHKLLQEAVREMRAAGGTRRAARTGRVYRERGCAELVAGRDI